MTVLQLKVGHDGDLRFDVAPRVRFSGNMFIDMHGAVY